MVSISSTEIKWAVIAVSFLLLASGLGFGVQGQSQLPSFNQDDINTDFIPNETPNFPDRSPSEQTQASGTIDINSSVYVLDAFNRQLYVSATESNDFVSVQTQLKENNAVQSTDTYTYEVNETGSASTVIQTGSGNITTVYTYLGGSTVDYEITVQPEEDTESGIISSAVRAVASAIQFVSDSIVFLVEIFIFLFQFIFGYIVGVGTAGLTTLVFGVNVVSFMFSGLIALAAIHPIVAIVMSIPTFIFSWLAFKLVLIIVEIVWIG